MVIPAARLKFYRRVKALESLVDGEQAPGHLVRSLIYLWQQRSFPRLLPGRAPWGSAIYLSDPAAKELAEWISKQPFDEAAYWLATVYALLVDKDIRNERALFFTPPRLAERVITNLVKHGASLTYHSWHDPACGGSAFLVPIALRMMSELADEGISARKKLKRIERSLSGNDLDAVLLEISKSLLEMALYPLIEASSYMPSFQLSHRDGLRLDDTKKKKFDVIICNPPYRKLKADEAERYRKVHGDVIEGQSNIYGLFINRTLQLCRRGGVVGLLTPTSFLSGHSFSKLRTRLLACADVLQIEMLGNRTSMFIDVLQETTISVMKPRSKSKVLNSSTRVSVLTEQGQFRDVGECLLPNSGSPWPIPRTEEDAVLIRLAEAARFGLSDYGYVARIGHLVAYRDKRPLFAKCPEVPNRRLIVPLVWATDIAPGGSFEHGREHRYKRNKGYVQIKKMGDHGVISQSVVLLQRLTSSDQRSRLVAAAVPYAWVEKHRGFVCENHVIVLEPNGEAAVSVETMAALLNTRSVDRVFRSISSANNVAVSELNELMLPDPKLLIRCIAVEDDIESAAKAAYERSLS